MPKGRYTPFTREILQRLYVEQELTTLEIARLWGVNPQTVANHLTRRGIPIRPRHAFRKRDKRNPRWNGGIYRHADGYIMRRVPTHPNAVGSGYVFEHRLVMERHLGRILKAEEVVHHRNGVRDDNRLENLEVMSKADHDRLHRV